MTLPYADKPKDSNVYRTLSNKQVKTLGARDFDIVREPIYTDYPNEDELRRLGLVARNAGMAQGGPPLSNSMATFNLNLGNGEAFLDIPEGQVWEIISVWMGQVANATSLQIAVRTNDPNYGESSEISMLPGFPVGVGNQAFGTQIYGTRHIIQQISLSPAPTTAEPISFNLGLSPSNLILTYPFRLEFQHVGYTSGSSKINGIMNRLR